MGALLAQRSSSTLESPGLEVQLQLHLLGGFEMTVGSEPMEVPDSGRRLLAYLALHDNARCRSVVAASLWPDKSESRAGANLRSSLWRLPSPGGAPLVFSYGPMLTLAPELRVDVRVAEELGWALVRDPSQAIDEVDRRLFFQELLPGWYDDWVIMERERLEQLQLHFLEALTYALVARALHAEALDVALRLVAADPLRERSQRALVNVYCDEGSLGQACIQLERYRKLMLETFGCEPSATLMRMVEERA